MRLIKCHCWMKDEHDDSVQNKKSHVWTRSHKKEPFLNPPQNPPLVNLANSSEE